MPFLRLHPPPRCHLLFSLSTCRNTSSLRLRRLLATSTTTANGSSFKIPNPIPISFFLDKNASKGIFLNREHLPPKRIHWLPALEQIVASAVTVHKRPIPIVYGREERDPTALIGVVTTQRKLKICVVGKPGSMGGERWEEGEVGNAKAVRRIKDKEEHARDADVEYAFVKLENGAAVMEDYVEDENYISDFTSAAVVFALEEGIYKPPIIEELLPADQKLPLTHDGKEQQKATITMLNTDTKKKVIAKIPFLPLQLPETPPASTKAKPSPPPKHATSTGDINLEVPLSTLGQRAKDVFPTTEPLSQFLPNTKKSLNRFVWYSYVSAIEQLGSIFVPLDAFHVLVKDAHSKHFPINTAKLLYYTMDTKQLDLLSTIRKGAGQGIPTSEGISAKLHHNSTLVVIEQPRKHQLSEIAVKPVVLPRGDQEKPSKSEIIRGQDDSPFPMSVAVNLAIAATVKSTTVWQILNPSDKDTVRWKERCRKGRKIESDYSPAPDELGDELKRVSLKVAVMGEAGEGGDQPGEVEVVKLMAKVQMRRVLEFAVLRRIPELVREMVRWPLVQNLKSRKVIISKVGNVKE